MPYATKIMIDKEQGKHKSYIHTEELTRQQGANMRQV